MTIEKRIKPHLGSLLRFARHLTGEKSAAEDLVQDTLVYILENRQKFMKLDPVRPWAMRCLYHRFVDNYRRFNRYELVSLECLDVLESPGQRLDDAYFGEQVLALIGTLSAAQRTAVSLFDIDGYSLNEIAIIMEIPQSTVKSHIYRGRKAIKMKL